MGGLKKLAKNSFFMLIVVIFLLIATFSCGVYVGSNRCFPYDVFRSLCDKFISDENVFDNESKQGVVLFGDSLTARGDWSILRDSKFHEILVLARGGQRAIDFMYSPADYEGDIHVFWLGTNDFNRGLDLTFSHEALVKLAQESASSGKKVIILGILEPVGISQLASSHIKRYNGLIMKSCEKYSWSFIDINLLLNERFPEREKISKDGIHLNLEASRYIAGFLKAECDQLLDN